MLDTPLTRSDLVTFFALPKKRPDDTRPLCRVLRDLGIRLRGGTTRWPIVWRALGLAEDQDPAHHGELTATLLTAQAVADLLGVSPSIVYRWEKGRLPEGAAPFPAAIDLSNGREAARARRWRKSEVLAWHMGRPLPCYAKPAPVFGAIAPAP
jgi:predicted DNA-binding transcriptional regulator AlpA